MPKPLTAAFVRGVKPESRVRRYGDGGNLYLVVKPGGRKSWIFRMVQPSGKRTDKGLGGFPAVSLAEARQSALEARHTLLRGGVVHSRPRRAAIPPFASLADEVIRINAPTWSEQYAADWRKSLVKYAFPTIGEVPVHAITTAHVLAIVEPVWHTRNKLAKNLRQRVDLIMRMAIAKGYRSDNPAGDALTAVLPRVEKKVRHHPAIPYGDLGAALAQVRDGGGPAALAVEFAALTAARRDEVREAVWDEIDLEAREWRIPAARMKGGADHRVPLSGRCVEILAAARAYGADGYVFPGVRAGRPLGEGAMLALWKAQGAAGTIDVLLTSFRTWTQEETATPNEVAEHALAHVVGDESARAYARSDLFEKRRAVMQAWAAYLGAESDGR